MKTVLEVFAIGTGLGVSFALGQWTWEVLSCRYLGWRRPVENSQTLTISVDNKQAMEALDELKRKVCEVSAIIAAVDTKAAKRVLQ
jgi:hypothetical protein